MAEKKNTTMSLERITDLITAMEDNAWNLLQIDIERIPEDNLYIERRAERWMTLHDILNILTRPEYADALAKIFLKDEGEEDTKEGGESDA
jgi:hypothetical protein